MVCTDKSLCLCFPNKVKRGTEKLAGRAKKTENSLKLKNRIIDHNQASFPFDGHRRKQCRP